MKIKYVGSQEYGAFAFEKAAKQYGHTFTEESGSTGDCFLEDLTTGLIQEAADWYIFDLSSLLDSESVLTSEIEKIRNATNGNIVLYAPGFLTDSKVLVSLRALGISNIITEPENLGILQESLTNYLLGAGTAITEEEQEMLIRDREQFFENLLQDNPQLDEIEAEPVSEEKAIDLRREPLTALKQRNGAILRIAVVGTQARIGTTTAALQLTKFLNLQEERSAAYLELNGSGYVESCGELFHCEREDAKLGCVVFQNIEMYYNPRKIPDILRQGYDYLVYDYGSIESYKDYSTLFEKDLILLVCGAKPNELQQATDAIRSVFEQKNVFYLFNYFFGSGEKNRKSILQLQEGCEHKTFFLSSAADPFLYNPEHDNPFFGIMNADYEPIDITAGKKKKLKRLFQMGRSSSK